MSVNSWQLCWPAHARSADLPVLPRAPHGFTTERVGAFVAKEAGEKVYEEIKEEREG